MSDDYLDRFGGVGRLLGREGLARLRAAHVCVVGVGGVGSWTVEGLARSGVGALTLVDLDDVCVTNVNRQLPALDGTVGRTKVSVLAERVRLINPACRVTEAAEFFTETSAERLMTEKFSCVVDAIDRMSNKALVIGTAHTLKGAAGNLSAKRLAALALELEDAGQSSDVARAAHYFPRLAAEAEELLTILSNE